MHRFRAITVCIAALIACLLAAPVEAQVRRFDAATLRMFHPACVQSTVPADHAFMAVAIRAGDTLANVQIGTKDETSTVIRVKVSPGSAPISLFLMSDGGVIWAFEGAVERIRSVVAANWDGGRRIGLAGLPRSVVTFADLATCPPRKYLGPTQLEQLKEFVATLSGRQPDDVMFESEARLVTLGAAIGLQRSAREGGIVYKREKADGSSEERTVTRDAQGRVQQRTTIDTRSRAERELYSMYPGGLRRFDPKDVISPYEVFTPEILPDQAGLAQLEQSGAIRRARTDEVAEWNEKASRPYRTKLSPGYRGRVAFNYVVTRETALPGGLHIGAGLKLLVPDGVPMPPKTPGFDCIARIDPEAEPPDPFCFGEDRYAVAHLRSLPAADQLGACRLIEPPADASLEAVSAYEPQNDAPWRPGARRERVALPIIVRVHKPGSVFLVLSTYSPVIWRIEAGSDVRIAGVLMLGYYTSTVEGVPPDTPMVSLDWVGRGKRAQVAAHCDLVHNNALRDSLGANYEPGPRAVLLDRQVHAVTGRSLDGFRGAYRMKEADIR